MSGRLPFRPLVGEGESAPPLRLAEYARRIRAPNTRAATYPAWSRSPWRARGISVGVGHQQGGVRVSASRARHLCHAVAVPPRLRCSDDNRRLATARGRDADTPHRAAMDG